MNYDDIIYLNHNISKRRTRMSLINRSAQFAPFDALEGFRDEVKETSRMTTKRIEISDDLKEKLNEKLNIILKDKSKKISITYFIKDKYKSGGSYKNIISYIKKIDENKKIITLINNVNIPIYEIIDIKIMI